MIASNIYSTKKETFFFLSSLFLCFTVFSSCLFLYVQGKKSICYMREVCLFVKTQKKYSHVAASKKEFFLLFFVFDLLVCFLFVYRLCLWYASGCLVFLLLIRQIVNIRLVVYLLVGNTVYCMPLFSLTLFFPFCLFNGFSCWFFFCSD